MTDNGYIYVIAEDVAMWLHNPKALKPCFEAHISGLTPLGQTCAWDILNVLKEKCTIEDDFTHTDVHDNGQVWVESVITVLFASNPLNDLIAWAFQKADELSHDR